VVARWFQGFAGKSHLKAVFIILLFVAAILGAMDALVGRVEAKYAHQVLASGEDFNSLRSLALERTVLHQPDLLPLYGSSELLKPVPHRPQEFFRDYPSGFAVYPIGKAGTYPLIMLQHLGAIAPDLKGKNVAISLSSGWFRESEMLASHYRGNYLPSTAREFLFSPHVSLDLRRHAARRMLCFPDTLARDPVTAFAAHHLAEGSHWDHLAYWSACPLGQLQIFTSRWQDHFEVAGASFRMGMHHVEAHHHHHHIDWPEAMASAAREAGDVAGREVDPLAASEDLRENDAEFLAKMESSPVWQDLDLLLRGLKEAGAHPLIFCTPVNGPHFARAGVSHAARDVFYRRLEAAVVPYHFTLRTFADHDCDRHFEYDQFDHLSAKGWLYYNRSLEAFVHDRPEGSYVTTEDLP
jgi:D-alanine transfer protein